MGGGHLLLEETDPTKALAGTKLGEAESWGQGRLCLSRCPGGLVPEDSRSPFSLLPGVLCAVAGLSRPRHWAAKSVPEDPQLPPLPSWLSSNLFMQPSDSYLLSTGCVPGAALVTGALSVSRINRIPVFLESRFEARENVYRQ